MDLREKIAEAIRGDERYPARAELSSAESIVDAVMGVVEARLAELEAKAHEDYSDDPWDHGYLRAIKDMKGEQ